MSKDAEKTMVKITGLYKSTDKNGNLVLSGSNNKISRFFVLHNNFKKENSNEPDCFLYFAENNMDKPEEKEKPDSRAIDL